MERDTYTILRLNAWIRTTNTRKSERCVLKTLACFANKDGECFPSLATIADDAGLGLSTVKRALRMLERQYLILRHRRPCANRCHMTTVYKLCVGTSGLTDEDIHAEDHPDAPRPLSNLPSAARVAPRKRPNGGSGKGWPTTGRGWPKSGQKASTEAIYFTDSSYPGSMGGGPSALPMPVRDMIRDFDREDTSAAKPIAAVLGRMKLCSDGPLARIRDRATEISRKHADRSA